MAYTDSNTVVINRLTKALYDSYVTDGTITQEMIDNQVWIFTDAQPVTAAQIAKLNGIETGAEVNIIEGITVNGTTATPTAKVVNIVVPTTTNDLTNNSGFITNTVNNLVNYYTKSEVTNLIGGISTLSLSVVAALPTTNISTSTIYLVLKSSGVTGNIYNEYIYTNSTWELIGDTTIDLTNYALISQLPTKLSDLTNDLNLSPYENVIEEVKVNGVALSITGKSVDITLPSCEAGAECNTIETIKVNGTPLVVDANKAVDITIPTVVTRVWS